MFTSFIGISILFLTLAVCNIITWWNESEVVLTGLAHTDKNSNGKFT